MAKKNKGVSLAKGPVAIIGMILLAYGITALIFGGHSFTAHPLSGAVTGKKWLGLEVNAWSSLLFIGAGALLLFGAPLHWAAKSMSLIVGIGLAVAGVLSFIDHEGVLGIFAANGLTRLVWVIAGGLLIILALLPRVGGDKADGRTRDDDGQRGRRRTTEPTRDPSPRAERDRPADEGAVASGETPRRRR